MMINAWVASMNENKMYAPEGEQRKPHNTNTSNALKESVKLSF